jgi:hypothetical protein
LVRQLCPDKRPPVGAIFLRKLVRLCFAVSAQKSGLRVIALALCFLSSGWCLRPLTPVRQTLPMLCVGDALHGLGGRRQSRWLRTADGFAVCGFMATPAKYFDP